MSRAAPIALALMAAAASLAACAHMAPTVSQACLPLKPYTPQAQQALAAALDALPAGSPLLGVMADYAAMRDADRACLATHP